MCLLTPRTRRASPPRRVRHSTLNISVVCGRKTGFFFWNAMLPFFLFVLLSFISLVRSGLNLGDKAQITLPMVLTAAACASLCARSLPGRGDSRRLPCVSPSHARVAPSPVRPTR